MLLTPSAVVYLLFQVVGLQQWSRLQLDLCVQSCRICVLRSSSSEEEGVVMRTRLRPGTAPTKIDTPDARLRLRAALNQQCTITTARYAAMQCARPRCASMCSPIQMRRLRTRAGSCARDATMVSQAANVETRGRCDSGLRVAGVTLCTDAMLLTVFRVTWTWQDAS